MSHPPGKGMPARSSIAIVGGGVLGMALASKLAEAGHTVRLFEAAPTTGGLASPDTIGGYTWDRFYHVILMSDRHLLAWLDRLGLESELEWGDTRTGFWLDGELRPLSSTWDYLRFPLAWIDKARLGLTILYASRIRHPARLERITALAWLTRWSGARVVERLWRPLLESKLGPMAPHASGAFIWAIIARMYAARRSGLKRERFGYIRGGYHTILTRLRQYLVDQDVEISAGAPVTDVRQDDTCVRLVWGDGQSDSFDHAILTVPCPIIAATCPQLTEDERVRLGQVVYQGVICPSLLLRRPLAGYYVTNLTDSRLPFTGIIEMTALVDPAQFGGHTLVYLPRYLTQDDDLWQQSDDQIVERFVRALQGIYPDLVEQDIVATRVARVRHVLAVSTIDYSDRALPPIATSLDRVSVVNSAQIAYGTLNVNETLALAEVATPELLRRVARTSPAAGVALPG